HSLIFTSPPRQVKAGETLPPIELELSALDFNGSPVSIPSSRASSVICAISLALPGSMESIDRELSTNAPPLEGQLHLTGKHRDGRICFEYNGLRPLFSGRFVVIAQCFDITNLVQSGGVQQRNLAVTQSNPFSVL
ncbi:hypothetical protein H4219_000974, partial [Mycoemilia scoparia]